MPEVSVYGHRPLKPYSLLLECEISSINIVVSARIEEKNPAKPIFWFRGSGPMIYIP